MNPDIWYAEELAVLRNLVEDAIRYIDPRDTMKMSALGHLHIKLTQAIAKSPSAKTPTGQG